jgi:hypothetical protein
MLSEECPSMFVLKRRQQTQCRILHYSIPYSYMTMTMTIIHAPRKSSRTPSLSRKQKRNEKQRDEKKTTRAKQQAKAMIVQIR